MQVELIFLGHVVEETIRFPERSLGPVLGSPVAYGSVVASRLGSRTGIVTKVGQDRPEGFLKPFCEAGVHLEGLKPEGPTTTTELVYYSSGDKRIHYWKKAPDILFDDVPASYMKARIACICPMDYEVPMSTIQALRANNLELAADLGGYGGAHVDKATPKKGVREFGDMRQLVGHFSVIKVSTEDCRHLFGDFATEEELARTFVEYGTSVATVTCGWKGSIVATARGSWRIPALPSEVVDTTGAGDSYLASFLSEYLRTSDVLRAGMFASATAACVIEETGGVTASRMPTRAVVERRLRSYNLDVQAV